MTPNFWAPACTHPSPVAALALRPSGACQAYQSPPQPPGPRRGGWLSALSAQPVSAGGCGRVCLGFCLALASWCARTGCDGPSCRTGPPRLADGRAPTGERLRVLGSLPLILGSEGVRIWVLDRF